MDKDLFCWLCDSTILDYQGTDSMLLARKLVAKLVTIYKVKTNYIIL